MQDLFWTVWTLIGMLVLLPLCGCVWFVFRLLVHMDREERSR